MPEFQILVDRTSPEHQQLTEALSRELSGIPALQVSTVEEPVGDRLAAGAEVVQFLVQHQDAILQWLPHVLSAVNILVMLRVSKKEKPVTVVVLDRRLALPASTDTLNTFIKHLGDGEAAPPAHKARNATRRKPKGGRAPRTRR